MGRTTHHKKTVDFRRKVSPEMKGEKPSLFSQCPQLSGNIWNVRSVINLSLPTPEPLTYSLITQKESEKYNILNVSEELTHFALCNKTNIGQHPPWTWQSLKVTKTRTQFATCNKSSRHKLPAPNLCCAGNMLSEFLRVIPPNPTSQCPTRISLMKQNKRIIPTKTRDP